MIRYTFTPLSGRPSAPFVYATIRDAGTQSGDELVDQPAQIDTGADRTVIPIPVVKHLGLLRLSNLEVAGLGGIATFLQTYLVTIEVRGLPPVIVEVVAADEPWILLGRDVTNQFRLLLDGPGSSLEIR